MQQQHIDRLAATQVRWAAVPGAPGAPEPNQPPPRPSRTTTAPPSNQLFGLHCPSLASDLKLKCRWICADTAVSTPRNGSGSAHRTPCTGWASTSLQPTCRPLDRSAIAARVPSRGSVRSAGRTHSFDRCRGWVGRGRRAHRPPSSQAFAPPAMRLRLLGFCGVDDSVDPRRMLALSRSHPFVEWGVLVRSEPRRAARTHSSARTNVASPHALPASPMVAVPSRAGGHAALRLSQMGRPHAGGTAI